MKNIIIGFMVLFLIGCSSSTQTESATVDDVITEDSTVESTTVEDVITEGSTAKAWYMKTIVKAISIDNTEYVHNTAGIFGELKESQDEKDRHDILAYGTGILQVVFPKTEWEENNGDYFSDYRELTEVERKQVWTFQVKNQRDINLADARLQLILYGPYNVTLTEVDGRLTYEESLSKDTHKKISITLIDVDNQVEYNYEELKVLQLNMDGLHTRTFRWIIGTVTQEDYRPLTVPIASRSVKFKSMIETFKATTVPVSNSKFGFPPLF